MVNGLGVLGWGVGGIEAEAVMLGQPYYMLAPEVVGFELTGKLREGTTATDLVLTITEQLRAHGVVGKFVEFFGEGLDQLPVADRATIANMAPEYGATMGFFPIDEETIKYLKLTGRNSFNIDLVEKYSKAQGLYRSADSPLPRFSDTLSLDMNEIIPSIAGPKRPQDRVPLDQVKENFSQVLEAPTADRGFNISKDEINTSVPVSDDVDSYDLRHGTVVIAAITSCTNTSNPSVMVGAGILAKKATDLGIHVKPWVKTSMAPGSKVVTGYLNESGLMPYLESQGFHTVGFGCTTCIGNSGPLPEQISHGIDKGELVATAVLSGNRNFEGRVNPDVKANYLASPILVVAYALAGRIDIDFETEPLAMNENNEPIYLRDVWPEQEEIQRAITNNIGPAMFEKEYGAIFDGDEKWAELPAPEGELYNWEDDSTYIQEPSYFKDFSIDPPAVKDIVEARILAILGDSVTTDHISPAGNIAQNSPAASYLGENGTSIKDFNSYGSRRGAHEVMMRGTFANIRLKNNMLDGVEGGYTMKWPEGIQMPIFDAASQYQQSNTPLIIIGGKEYGSGSSRDWAAKGPFLLGVRAVIAESYERIHRSNLVGMGILPLEFQNGDSAKSLSLSGNEIVDIEELPDQIEPSRQIRVTVTFSDGTTKRITTTARIDTTVETEYYQNGGILQTVLRKMINED
jgi:aconitate hydratase